MKTKKIYQENVYLKQAELKPEIIAVTKEECEEIGAKFVEGSSIVVFPETIFFPEGGGQPCDLGNIDAFEVIDVKELKDSGMVIHRVKGDASALKEKESVHCSLDWTRRFDHMQMHCGEHILSGIFYKLYGISNEGFHMGEDYMTIDMALPENGEYSEITPEMIRTAELKANEAVWADLPITTQWFDTREEANERGPRKKIKFDEDISLVYVGDLNDPVDLCACCGTHPATTGQIGLIIILKAEKYKGMTRFTIKAGRPALMEMLSRSDVAAALGKKYSCEPSQLIEREAANDEKNNAARRELSELKGMLMAKAEEELIEAAAAPREISILIKEYPMYSADDLQSMARKCEGKISCVCALYSEKDKSVVISSPGEPNAGKLVKDYANMYGGKGGGNNKLARAIFTKSADAQLFIDLIEKHLR